jgi:alkanesulfonate monooxygenase SsuD/methylene tetrahydromethanopterin reductase-like flavin-dependent oxidoreductase (luciferase family)
MATATDTPVMIELAASRGYTLLSAQLEPAQFLKKRAERYASAAMAAGHARPLANITVARYVYLADSKKQAMDDLRDSVNYELGFQKARGLIRILKSNYDLPISGDDLSFDELAETGVYFLGDPDTVAGQLKEFYNAAGGFGTLLIVVGKDWATREKRARSMRLFMDQVAPRLRGLEPTRALSETGASG